jgi:hypothetical protein
MAAADDAVIFKIVSTKYNLCPGNVEYIGQRHEENQSVGVSESGVVKVANISSAAARFIEFRINAMPVGSRTYNTLTVQGWSGLSIMLRSLRGRYTTFLLKLAGAVEDSPCTNYLTVRYWDSTVTEQTEGQCYSGKLTFRVESA